MAGNTPAQQAVRRRRYRHREPESLEFRLVKFSIADGTWRGTGQHFGKGASMRSVIFEKFGPPEQVLTLVERPVPEPGPGQVRVKMILSPIHNHDLMIISGRYGYKPELPAVPGTEAMGVVDALGEGVLNLQLGDRVAGGNLTWADYYLLDARRAIILPDTISDETGAQLVSMPLSALMLLDDLGAKEGDWIVQNAANGAVARLVARFGKERGINVLGLVRRDEGVAELEKLGIGNVVSTQSQGWRDKVKAITGGAPILRAVDSVSGDATDEIMGLLSEGGTLVSFGAMSERPMVISPENLLFKGTSVRGFWLARMMQTASPELVGRLIGELIGLAASGKLELPVEEVFDISQVAEAVKASAVPGRAGKVMLTS
jgi:NADPH:quinone reductase-like Zn-dependent oxidoreductase